MRLLLYPCLLVFVMVLSACGGGTAAVYIPQERSLFVGAGPVEEGMISEITGELPLAITTQLLMYGGETDDGDEHKPQAVEWDPGDGTGYIDVSAEYYTAIVDHPNSADAQVQDDYTYTTTGEYQITARVTWWDGEVTTQTGPTVTVTEPEQEADDGGDGGTSEGDGFDEEDEWVIRSFTDPRDDTVYDIIDGRVLVAFYLPLDQDAANDFIIAEELDLLSEWWMIGCVSALLPEGTTVEDAVGNWPDEYPGLVESVDPDVPVEGT